MLQQRSGSRRGLSSMDPPAVPNPRPLQASSTQSSFASTSSSNSLFSLVSRTSSMSSIASERDASPRTSPLKRGADAQHVSPSPSKYRKLSEASPQSGMLPESPILERLHSTDMSSPSKTQPSPSPYVTGNSFSLAALFGGQHGSALEKHEIAHSTEVQKEFDNLGVHLGVQWELARGVSIGTWTWEDVAAKMKAKFGVFKGSNSTVAWRVPDIMRGRQPSQSHDLALWSVLFLSFIMCIHCSFGQE